MLGLTTRASCQENLSNSVWTETMSNQDVIDRTVLYTWMDSPIGKLLLTSDGRSLTGLYLDGQKYFPRQTENWAEAISLDTLAQAKEQLTDYFAGQRQRFSLVLNPHGTNFQKQVWQALQQIPYGETVSYATLAHRLGKPGASRAVGAANGRNPIAIIVPCHRVVAASGKLTGYAGGLERKQWLLQHEQLQHEEGAIANPCKWER